MLETMSYGPLVGVGEILDGRPESGIIADEVLGRRNSLQKSVFVGLGHGSESGEILRVAIGLSRDWKRDRRIAVETQNIVGAGGRIDDHRIDIVAVNNGRTDKVAPCEAVADAVGVGPGCCCQGKAPSRNGSRPH